MPSKPKRPRPERRRTAMSCDRCKHRKTKVRHASSVEPKPSSILTTADPGPCQFCASIGAPCRLDPSRRRQRPYYRVSEEEFRYMTQILEHFVPDTDLNLHTLKALAGSLGGESGQGEAPGRDVAALTPAASSSVSPAKTEALESHMEAGEIDELHQQLGWLRVDSNGVYRHVGANSTYGFLDAVRSLKSHRPAPSPKPEVLAPLSAASPLPPSSPESAAHLKPPSQISLPRRDLCDACVARFFRDIQSVYWFFSAEQLHGALDRIYSGDAAAATPSMLCGLYSIFALTSESQVEREGGGDARRRPGGKYLALAKSMVPALCDDGDIDSVRALCLLGLALSSSMFGNTAYVYIGAAARIAFTLGLHSHVDVGSRHSLHGQADMRLFCTLYQLDLDVALCYGHPPAVGEEIIPGALRVPSEDILSPGTNMPLGYIEASCTLARLKRSLSRLVYRIPSSSPGRISIPAVSSELDSLKQWYSDLPNHLRDYSQVTSHHSRSVAVLHLRYWRAVAFATRPFLLHSVSRGRNQDDSPKRRHFDDFSAACVEAAERSLEIAGFLRDRGLLTSLIALDCTCVLECMQVFVLALAEGGSAAHLQNVGACLRTLRGMEQILWPRHALTEVTAQLEEHGIWDGDDVVFPPGLGAPGLLFMGLAPPSDFASDSGIFFHDFHQEGMVDFMPSPQF